jgi:hypothetical protein
MDEPVGRTDETCGDVAARLRADMPLWEERAEAMPLLRQLVANRKELLAGLERCRTDAKAVPFVTMLRRRQAEVAKVEAEKAAQGPRPGLRLLEEGEE